MAPARPSITSDTARLIDAIAASALDPSGCPGVAVIAMSSATTGSASANVAAASSGSTTAMATSRLRQLCALGHEVRIGHEIERRGPFFSLRAGKSAQRDIRPDPGRFAEGQRQRKSGSAEGRGAGWSMVPYYCRYSIIAPFRNSFR